MSFSPEQYQRINDELFKLPTPDLLGYLPSSRESNSVLLPRSTVEPAADGLPMPPRSLWVTPDYGDTEEAYLRIGSEHVERMKTVLRECGYEISEGHAVLDFGCAGGRLTRWLKEDATRARVMGVDINAEAVAWCRQHLSPPFQFCTSTLSPHLPFRDGSFDLVFAGSVFTHIDDLADMWLAELNRILKPGGFAYLTIHDEASIRLLDTDYSESYFGTILKGRKDYSEFCETEFDRFSLNRGIRSQVFYRRDYFRHMASPWFESMAFEEEAYIYQTAAVLRSIG